MPASPFWSRARRARLPRVLLVYLAASWIVVQVANELREALSLPAWISPVVILLLLVGLVIISATAWVQADPLAPARAKSEEIPDTWEIDLGDVRESVAEGRIPHLTWARAIVGGVVAFSLLFGLAGAYVLIRNEGPAEARARGRTMIAVLPFENLGALEDGYFADGMTEEITARLASLQGLGVISRTSTLQYKGTTKPIKQIGKELGVDYVLEGSVRWQPGPGGRKLVRITPQLIKVSDDSHVWADVYEEDSAEIFRIQSDIAGQVAQALDVALKGPERQALEATPTENLEAYDYYLRGNDYADRSSEAKEQRLAAEMYEKAVGLDPSFAAAWARLSKAHTRLYFMFADPSLARLASAKRAVDTALRLTPELSEAHLALGYYYYWGLLDYDRALEEFAIARKGQPGNAELEESTGFVQRRQGRFDDALAALRRAAELDPRSSPRAYEVGLTLLIMRRYSEAEPYLDRAISLQPDDPAAHQLKFLLYLDWAGDTTRAKAALLEGMRTAGEAQMLALVSGTLGPVLIEKVLGADASDRLARLGKEAFGADTTAYFLTRAELHAAEGRDDLARAYADSARASVEKVLESRPDEGEVHGSLALALALLGQREEAVREGRRGVELLPFSRDALSQAPWRLAKVLAQVGEDDAAVDQLETILAVPWYVSSAYIAIDPHFDTLHDNPRFQKLVADGKP